MPVLQTVGNYFRNLAGAVTGRSVPPGVTAGSIGFSAGGPLFLDAFRSKRPPAPYELVNAYKAIAYSCIRLNQHGVARTALKLYAKTGRKQARPRRSCSRVASLRTERYIRSQPYLARNLEPDDAVDEIKEHPFLEALEHPNPYFDYDLLIQHVVASMDVIGTSYFYPTRPLGPDGNPDVTQARVGMEIWPFQAQYVYPYKGVSIEGLLKEYRYFGDTYPPNALIRIRYPSLRDPYLSAYSPLHACFEQAGLTDYYYAIVESILKVGARPSAMVSPKDSAVPLGESERKRIESDLNNRFTGGRSGHIWVSNGALDIKELQFPPADLAGLKITENMRLLVANCFDVPISLLQAEDTNRAVASEGTHQHQYYAIEPRCRAIATALTNQLAWPVDERLFFCFDNPVDRDEEQEAKVWGMKLADGRATANEAREDEGLDPVEWGHEPWLSQTLIQPTQQQQNHQLALKQQFENHEQGKREKEQGLKQSAEQHEMGKDAHGLTMKQGKAALDKDAEDRAREESSRKRTFEQNERAIDITKDRLNNEVKIAQINADAAVEKEKVRSVAEVTRYREKIKALRSSNDDLMEVAKEKLSVEAKQARDEERTLANVNDLVDIMRRDALSCSYAAPNLRFNPNHNPHDGRFDFGHGIGAGEGAGGGGDEGDKPSKEGGEKSQPKESKIKLPDDDLGSELGSAVDAINSVHPKSDLPSIEVKTTAHRDTHGQFFSEEWEGKPTGIEVSKNGDHPHLTLAHEYGHYVDHSGGLGDGEGMYFRNWETDSVFKDWHATAQKSEAVQSLNNLLKQESVEVDRVDMWGKAVKSNVKVPTDYVEYLSSPHEIWARSYAQYVATRSGNSSMKRQLSNALEETHGLVKIPVQWSDADFAPIAKAMDKIFKDAGWAP